MHVLANWIIPKCVTRDMTCDCQPGQDSPLCSKQASDAVTLRPVHASAASGS